MRRRPVRRPWTRLASAALAGHVAFELGAGVGLPLASFVGPGFAVALWTAGTALTQRAAASPSADVPLTLINGIGLAAVVAHLSGWPRRRTLFGLPWLTTCEGLGGELMPAYNGIVYVGGLASTVALLTENRRAPGWLAVLPLVLAPALVRLQHVEHDRLRAIATRQPGWWNRRLVR